MDISDGIIDRWAGEAIQDLGDKGWREIDSNSMLLIIYSVLKSRDEKLLKKITKPIWYLLGALGTGVLWYVISSALSMGG